MLTFLTCKKKAVRAKVVCWNKAPCLIVSFKNSAPPQVWQMDLEKLTSYTLKLQEQEGEWDLGYVVTDGAFKAVAHFDERPDAEEAYDVIQNVLINSDSVCAQPSRPFAGGIMRGLLALLGVVFIVLMLFNWVASGVSSLFAPSGTKTEQTSAPRQRTLEDVPPDAAVLKTEPQVQVGVPQNADDILPKDVE